jgi:hypothetical protein
MTGLTCSTIDLIGFVSECRGKEIPLNILFFGAGFHFSACARVASQSSDGSLMLIAEPSLLIFCVENLDSCKIRSFTLAAAKAKRIAMPPFWWVIELPCGATILLYEQEQLTSEKEFVRHFRTGLELGAAR